MDADPGSLRHPDCRDCHCRRQNVPTGSSPSCTPDNGVADVGVDDSSVGTTQEIELTMPNGGPESADGDCAIVDGVWGTTTAGRGGAPADNYSGSCAALPMSTASLLDCYKPDYHAIYSWASTKARLLLQGTWSIEQLSTNRSFNQSIAESLTHSSPRSWTCCLDISSLTHSLPSIETPDSISQQQTVDSSLAQQAVRWVASQARQPLSESDVRYTSE
eukprot:GHVU01149451.1.p1 GENE.GHVU01149451.1~~GHVU01149451.1.p1  ORF type:complete len:248 (-),score=47.32 GHVU01149451.1:178-831(-)